MQSIVMRVLIFISVAWGGGEGQGARLVQISNVTLFFVAKLRVCVHKLNIDWGGSSFSYYYYYFI